MLERFFKLIIYAFRLKVFRYFIAAGTATVVDVGTYFLSFNYLLQKKDILFSFGLLLTAPIASLIISFSCGLVTNFLITKFYVFNQSTLKTRVQFFRFALVAFGTLLSNYFLMKFLILYLQFFPTISRLISALTIGVLSFITHKAFTFKINGKEVRI